MRKAKHRKQPKRYVKLPINWLENYTRLFQNFSFWKSYHRFMYKNILTKLCGYTK